MRRLGARRPRARGGFARCGRDAGAHHAAEREQQRKLRRARRDPQLPYEHPDREHAPPRGRHARVHADARARAARALIGVYALVSAAWGVLVFKEIKGLRNYCVLALAVSLTIAGCVMIGMSRGD